MEKWILIVKLTIVKQSLLIGEIRVANKDRSDLSDIEDGMEDFAFQKLDKLNAYIHVNPLNKKILAKDWIETFNSVHDDIVVNVSGLDNLVIDKGEKDEK